MSHQSLLSPILNFLKCETPDEWIDYASQPEHLSALLIDHCNCELKAAQTAIFLIRKYAIDKQSGDILADWAKPYQAFVYRPQNLISNVLDRDAKKNELIGELTARTDVPFSQNLIDKMVRLIKEEFHHFEQVLSIMQSRGIEYHNLRASRYAKGLMTHVITHEPATLVDKLIVGAFIEARSCERFAKLAPHLDDELNRFYVSLLRSEARHYQDYLSLAESVKGSCIAERVAFWAEKEAELILASDDQFNFHSGVPCKQSMVNGRLIPRE